MNTQQSIENERNMSLIVPSGVGYLLGIVYLVFISPNTIVESYRYIFRKPEVAVWCFLIAGQVAFLFGITMPLIRKLREYRTYFFMRKRELALSGLIIFLLILLFLLSHQTITGGEFPVHYQRIKIIILTSIGLIVLVRALYGIYLVGTAVRHLIIDRSSAFDSIGAFIKYKDDLSWFLLVAGFIVGGATLCTGALQKALIALNGANSFSSPYLVLIYGAFGSGLIALIFIPSHLALLDTGKKLCNELLEMPKGNVKELLAWNKERNELETFFGLKGSTVDTFKTGIAILSPLIGSAVSLFIGKG